MCDFPSNSYQRKTIVSVIISSLTDDGKRLFIATVIATVTVKVNV
ncbi:hypothetical protein NX722_26915 [Endozoicomonas gorgoniicola]|uniref:Uncharacterized protein n=1 Tax=Endozoicomonas gorgoniicola TaxID=1234144 RepID=A0ABT3N3K1_9GAMM|nr:hypothetical protein [Endozoicomonas gorgoniicola]MCW7556194.1 hypothetical protein [Endozoicomonas gorgoniicola]